ncbi:hypothetical protein [Alteromonas flava]|uniref:hypothetical protein n=1 Tax=Alteromonas flava TaxID=2048003 RepID=UPI000C292B4F|nr:hypothetical protein [Alteromonas flava]
MNKSVFASHGSFTIEIDENCRIVDGRGPYNQEIVQEYEHAIAGAIDTLSGGSWTQIIILHGLSLFTPDAAARLKQTVLMRKTRGLTASAVVIGDVDGKNTVTQQMQSIYQECGIAFDFFDNVDSAQIWLKTL